MAIILEHLMQLFSKNFSQGLLTTIFIYTVFFFDTGWANYDAKVKPNDTKVQQSGAESSKPTPRPRKATPRPSKPTLRSKKPTLRSSKAMVGNEDTSNFGKRRAA